MQYIRKITKKILPLYGLCPLLITFIVNCLAYGGAKLIAGNWKHYCMETVLDQRIPFLPWTLAIYLGCYLFWIVNYVIIAGGEREEVDRFFLADVMSRIICFALFLALPTTNHRPVISENGFWNLGMKFLYTVDSAENLFPSIHCLTSWFCFIGVRRRKGIPKWYRFFSAAAAVAVFLATLTTKQHVIVDVVGGVLLSEGCFFLSGCGKAAELYGKLMDALLSCFSSRREVKSRSAWKSYKRTAQKSGSEAFGKCKAGKKQQQI
ncbi:MAG: phosphatase PAP2 family protein [Fusicatenibacter sp.]|nr:phosphatase PAP2 family protein [Fusicatenibacter sp.]